MTGADILLQARAFLAHGWARNAEGSVACWMIAGEGVMLHEYLFAFTWGGPCETTVSGALCAQGDLPYQSLLTARICLKHTAPCGSLENGEYPDVVAAMLESKEQVLAWVDAAIELARREEAP